MTRVVPGSPAANNLPLSLDRTAIRRAEVLLRRAGFLKDQRPDGLLDGATGRALRAFQKSVGLPETGMLNERTLKKLESVGERIQESNGKVLGQGQKSDRVKKTEKRLERLGYDVGRADGVFDADTAKGVKAFKKDQKALRGSKSGLVGTRAQKTLEKETRAINHKPRTVEREATRERKVQDRLVERASKRGNGINEGDRGQAVEVVQRHLRAAGYDPKRVDGNFDERTAGMVREFQRREKLPTTGRVDPRTWRELSKVTVEKNSLAEQRKIMKRARTIGNEINRTGGYRFDGRNDCWGFVRRVWDPLLARKGLDKLPVSDAGSASGKRNWDRITNWKKIPVGTPLSTHEGHAWGADWHGGLFAGVRNGQPYIYDCSGSRDGCYLRPMPPGLFKYYYKPAAKTLD